MSRLRIENWARDSTDDCAWTDEHVELTSGDLFLDDEPFGTYFAASYPESGAPPHFIVNVVNASGAAVLSMPFRLDAGGTEKRFHAIEERCSPWRSDGILIGPIPSDPLRSGYTQAGRVLEVAVELVRIEPSLALYRGGA